MNFLEKLLDGAEVEWKELGDLSVKISSGKNKEKNEIGTYPVFGSTGVIGWTNNKVYVKEQILVARVGANAGQVNIAKGEYDVSDNTLIVENKECIILKYLYYYLVNINLNQFAQGAGQPLITGGQLKLIQIPIPCPNSPEKSLKIQSEIVRILDTFTTMTAELTAELTIRKKQYNYYRDQLLTFKDDEVEWKTLGDISLKISSGGTPKTGVAEYWEGGTIPWMSSGEVNLETIYETEKYITEAGLKSSSAKFVPKNSIVIALAGQGKTRGKVARIRIDLTTNQSLASLTFDEMIVNPDYVYHFLKTQYENLRQISSGNGARGGLNLQMISNYKLPIPALSRQTSIVAILDKFDVLTSSNTEGLPREIKLRQQQYEYYRDLLLSFPQLDSEAMV